MQRLGVRLINASIEGYHAQLDRRAHISLRTVLRAENDELIETAEHRWHPSLPLPPDNWLKSTTFDLTAEEASFLSERIQMSVPDTMLAACLVHSFANQSGAPFIWDLAGLQVLSSALRQVVRDAEVFSLIMWGASLLYNKMLADKAAGMDLAQSGRWQQIYSQQLEQWTVEMLANASLWSGLDRTAYWDRVRLINPGLSPQSIAFCDTWFARAFSDPTSIANDTAMQTLIVARERISRDRSPD